MKKVILMFTVIIASTMAQAANTFIAQIHCTEINNTDPDSKSEFEIYANPLEEGKISGAGIVTSGIGGVMLLAAPSKIEGKMALNNHLTLKITSDYDIYTEVIKVSFAGDDMGSGVRTVKFNPKYGDANKNPDATKPIKLSCQRSSLF